MTFLPNLNLKYVKQSSLNCGFNSNSTQLSQPCTVTAPQKIKVIHRPIDGLGRLVVVGRLTVAICVARRAAMFW